MDTETEIKQQVREFYNQVGWQEVSEGLYQNARYEDLRPVAREYIDRCHRRVAENLAPNGRFFLDAGSGPIQYPAYVEYSQGYQYRVCADISLTALQEARTKIGDHGLFVVADIANLPFAREVFTGVISLHTIHHLPQEQHLQAFEDLYRVLAPEATAVVVNGWKNSPLNRIFDVMIRVMEQLWAFTHRSVPKQSAHESAAPALPSSGEQTGTFVNKHEARWFKNHVGNRIPADIRSWRSLSVGFMRTFVHERWGGRRLLRFIYQLEEIFPRFFGVYGVYPLVILHKPKSRQLEKAQE